MLPPPSVAVIGAGAAGLAAAARFVAAGWAVTVFEARDRIGGRCAQATLGGQPVDLGAEFSHGRGRIFSACADAGMPPPRAVSEHGEDAPPHLRPRFWDGSELRDGGSRATPGLGAMFGMWDELLCDDAMAPDGAAADSSFEEVARARGADGAALAVLHAFCSAEYSTDLSLLGAKEWRRREHLFDAGVHDCGTDYSMEGRYVPLLQTFADRATAGGATLRLSTLVGRVEAIPPASPGSRPTVVVDGATYDAAVVTVPIGALQQGRRTLELLGVRPGLHDAISRVGYHPASKVMVVLSHKPWAGGAAVGAAGKDGEDGEDGEGIWAQLLLCSDGASLAKQVWVRETGGVCIAVGFCAGPTDAGAAQGLSKEAAADTFVEQLRRAYRCGDELRWLDVIKVDWGADPWAGLGAYSSPAVGGCDVWRELRDTGVANLLLAGEAVPPQLVENSAKLLLY